MSEAILSVQGVSKRFGGVQALQDVSFDLAPGDVMALAGDNGAGKSTLIKIISGVYQADSGSMTYRNSGYQPLNPKHSRDLGIETIYQDLALADNLDVGANIFLGREPVRQWLGMFPVIDRQHMRNDSQEVLKNLDIDIPESSLDQPVRRLSGGQRQAVAISRAIYWNAEVLIMDEPTAALGVPEQRKVMDLIGNLKARKIAIIFISHNLNDIFAVTDRILVLRRGQKVGECRTAEVEREEIVRMMVQG
jgi:ABC-type sugar transport system ATPase subunit